MSTCANCHSRLQSSDTFCGNCGRPVPRTAADGSRVVVLGRDPACDIVVDHPKVSGRHCKLTFAGSTATVEDLGSSNGTFLGAGKRKISVRVNLGAQDELFLGPHPVSPAGIARRLGIVWPVPGVVAPTVLEELTLAPPPQPPCDDGMLRAIAQERKELEREREASERAREHAQQIAHQAQLAAERAAAEAAHAQELARAQAKARDNRSGWDKGSDAANTVAGFGCGCVGWIILAIIAFFLLVGILAKA